MTCTMMMMLTWVRRSISPSISLNMASMSSICWKSRTEVDALLPNLLTNFCLFLFKCHFDTQNLEESDAGKFRRQV